MTADKFDKGKPDYTLLGDLHPGTLDDIIRVLEFGAKKYSRANWKQGIGDVEYEQRIHAAILRHALAALHDDHDSEHGLPHLSALIVDALFADSLRRWREEDEEDRAEIEKTYSLEEATTFFDGYDFAFNPSPSRIAGDTDLAIALKNPYYGHNPHEIIHQCDCCGDNITADDDFVTEGDWVYCSLTCARLSK